MRRGEETQTVLCSSSKIWNTHTKNGGGLKSEQRRLKKKEEHTAGWRRRFEDSNCVDRVV